MRYLSFVILASLVAAGRGRAQMPARLEAVGLRCDGAVDPLGIDSPPPRLSWEVQGLGRGIRQTAWQVMAASSARLLAANRADLWDSGKVVSDEQIAIRYGGKNLRSGERVYWKVRVWNGSERSAWSAPGTWTMGLLTPSDWTADWIGDGDCERLERAALGYRSNAVVRPSTRVWVQIDLGSVKAIDSVRLLALHHTVVERLGFPLGFKVEVASDPDMAGAKTVADYTAADYPNPWTGRIDLPAGALGRYVRLTATRLRSTDGAACLALSQIEVLSGGRNIAVGAAVTASDSIEAGPWRASALTDGKAEPGLDPLAGTTILLRREFAVRPGLVRALLFVSGLGQYELDCNGARVGDDVLCQSWTQYERTIAYDTRDLTGMLHAGRNALGLCVGGGPYNIQETPGRYNKLVTPYRPPVARAQLQLEYADGSVERIVTDGAWRTRPGPTTYANFYGGEDFDARLVPAHWNEAGFDDGAWQPAAVLPGPGGLPRGAAEADPPVRIYGPLEPVEVREVGPGVTVYDLGQNASIIPRIAVRGAAGSVVRIIPAELLHADGTVDRRSEGGSLAYWQYTLAGRDGGETWNPGFFYSGARYLQVERTAPDGAALPTVSRLEGEAVASQSPPAGDFACSSDLFNRIRLLVRWAQRNNLMHVITDCPHRERLGWLEQTHLNGPALRYEFDLGRLFGKALADMEDAQAQDGLVPEIAPEYTVFPGDFRDSPEWGSALILTAWQQYLWTGDDTVLREHYAAMQRYVAYLGSRAQGHLLAFGLGDWFDLGPGKPGPAQLTPISLTATAFFQADVATLAVIAEHLGQYGDARRYAEHAEVIREAFNRAFFDPNTGRYAAGSQTAQALALVFNLPELSDRSTVFNALVRDVQDHGNAFTAGDVGYRYVLRALADGGRSDLIAGILARTDVPGYGYQLAHGCTSLAEAWNADPRASQDHFMLGQIVEWFYRDLAGLAPQVPGFERVLFAPQPVPSIAWARASHQSARGTVAVAWHRDRGRFTLVVDVPGNATGEVRWPYVGSALISESGRRSRSSSGVHYLRREKGHPIYEVQSGHYEFTGPEGPMEGP